MNTVQHNKLVRDRIPEIIETSGKTCVTEILSDEDYLRMLDAKLDEELAEYHQDQNIEELADLLEVIRAAAVARGYSIEELEKIRAEKAAKRGGFEKRILLKEVEDLSEHTALASAVISNWTSIMMKLDAKALSPYYWLQDNLYSRDVSKDMEYKRKFGGYYRMRFVSQQYRDAFFSIFEQIKYQRNISFEEVATELYPVDNKHEFSFISKMLHTINPTRPIFDSQVNKALDLKRTAYFPNLEKRIEWDGEILNKIALTYGELLRDKDIRALLTDIDEVVPGQIMTPEKKLDFILWALGGL